MDLDKYIAENCLSIDSIKSYVDDYSLFSHYIGEELELGRVYSSPLRVKDENPSFSLYEVYGDKYKNSEGNIIFKDYSTELKGNAFRFIQYILSEDKSNLISFRDVLNQINIDFDLGLSGTPKTFKPLAKVLKAPEKRERPKIEIVTKMYTPIFKNYFKGKYDITEGILRLYNTYNVHTAYYKYPSKQTAVVHPKGLCIAYKIGKYYKLYSPFEERKYKFRNDFPPTYAEGFLQLQYKKQFVIITKAMKEVLFFRQHFDFDSVAGKSETTPIPKKLMSLLFERYKYVILWLDRDNGGKKATEYYLEEYPGRFILLNYPENVVEKDPTDRYEALKIQGNSQLALDEINNILNDYI